MVCKHCGKKLKKDATVCPSCGKKVGNDVLKIILAAIAGVVVVAALAFVVYVGTNGWPEWGKKEPQMSTMPTEDIGTTPTDGNPYDVTCKGTYTADKNLDEATKEALKNDVVATMGEHTLTNRQLQVYYWMSVMDFVKQWGSYLSYFGLDLTKPLDRQLYDEETGMSWQQFFLQGALDNWRNDTALFLEAEAAGYQLDQEYQAILDGMYADMQATATKDGYIGVDAMLKHDMGEGADFQGYMYYMTHYYKGNLYYNDSYQDFPVTMEQIEEYYEANKENLKASYKVDKESGIVADVQYLLFFPDGATKDTVADGKFEESAWETARAKAQAAIDQWVAEGATEEGFKALIELYGKEDNTGGTADEYTNLPKFDMAEVDVRHILIKPENGTTDASGNTVYSEADWEAARVKAQNLLDQWVASGADEVQFILLCKENSADGNAADGGLYTNVTKDYMVEEFDAWIFDPSRQYGDYGLVKTQFGYHLMFFVHGDTEVDKWLFDENRQVGDYTLLKTDYGYYVLRFTGSEEGWIRYARASLQAAKMKEEVLAKYPMTVEYSKIILWAGSLS